MEISSLLLYIYCNNKCFHFNLQERFWVDDGSTKTVLVMAVLKSESFPLQIRGEESRRGIKWGLIRVFQQNLVLSSTVT